jgi:hypothetical protein
MKILSFSLLICATFLFGACGTIYAPNTVNTPLFHEKGEIQLHIDNQSNVQAAMAVSNHLGLMVNGAFPSYTGTNNEEKSSGSLVEVGLGYFKGNPNGLIMEIYGGAGTGKADLNTLSSTGQTTSHIDAQGTRLFVQPSVGLSRPFFDIAFTPRFSLLKYSDANYNGFSASVVDERGYAQLTNTSWLFLEPALTLRGGYKFIKAQIQLGKTIKLTDKNLAFAKSFNSFGITLDIGKWYNKH